MKNLHARFSCLFIYLSLIPLLLSWALRTPLEETLTGFYIFCVRTMSAFSNNIRLTHKIVWKNRRVPAIGNSSNIYFFIVGIFWITTPCNNFPLTFLLLLTPSALHVPHCLKKNGIWLVSACRLMFKTHSSFIGRACTPLSPPTITQFIPLRSNSPKSSRSGSHEMNRIGAFKCRI